MPAPDSSRPSGHWLMWAYRLLILLGASLAFIAVWVVLAWSNAGQYSAMALLGALDVAWVMRLTGWPAGRGRALVGVLAAAAIVAIANWWIIAVHLGAAFGLDPLASALRLGLDHAWLLAGLANGPFDLAMYGLALVVAGLASR